ncbi:hypothetical protein [Draconibacterium sp.]|uniref:hypothetical protein n=1 Tax=Draconibacterium sp. TaxID=1965318 RepID=UPI003567FEBA
MNTKKKTGQFCTGSLTNSKVQKIQYRKSQAVKYLEQLANNEVRAKNPNTPVEWLAPRKYKDDTANGLTKCVIDFIRFNGGQAERIGNTGRMIDTRSTFTDYVGQTRTIGQTKWITGTGTNGTADISATISGKSVKIEVKIGKDRQSEAQKNYQKAVEKAGGNYVLATSFEQFFNWYKANFGEGSKL